MSPLVLMHVLDQLKLEVGKEYNLNNVKEILTTDDFLTLDRETIGCQNEESLDNCKTRHYQDALINQCGCLPFSIGNLNQVYFPLLFLSQTSELSPDHHYF